MTQEDKNLLLKDLCGRLCYGIFVKENHDSIDNDPVIYTIDYHPCINDCKPYLRPISSMTIDELDDCMMNSGLRDIPSPAYKGSEDEIEESRLKHSIKVLKTSTYCIDWLNVHHFDYRGLIEKGLALEAPEGMYNLK